MTATEVIAEIKRMPRPEQEAVVSYIRDELLPEVREIEGGAVSPKFKQMAEHIFSTHAELFRKLAR